MTPLERWARWKESKAVLAPELLSEYGQPITQENVTAQVRFAIYKGWTWLHYFRGRLCGKPPKWKDIKDAPANQCVPDWDQDRDLVIAEVERLDVNRQQLWGILILQATEIKISEYGGSAFISISDVFSLLRKDASLMLEALVETVGA